MTTIFGKIKSATWNNIAEIYTSGDTVTLWLRPADSNKGLKFILDESNISDFMDAIMRAARSQGGMVDGVLIISLKKADK